MATFTFEARNKPASKHPERCSIYLRITHNRVIKKIKVLEVTLKDGKQPDEVLNPKDKWLHKKYINKDAIREEREIKKFDSIMKDQWDSAESMYLNLRKDGLASASKIKSELKSDGCSNSFSDFLDSIINSLEEAGRYSDWKKFNGFRNKFNGFISSKGRSEILFNELDASLLKQFENWLHLQRNIRQPSKMLNPNSIKLQMVLFKRIINKALEMGTIKPDKNPFVAYKMPKEIRTSKDKLSPDEIKLMEDAELESGSVMDLARNTFLFSYYCAGIRFEDVALMRCADIQDGRLVYTMAKNGKKRDLKLIAEALKIAESYMGENPDPDDYLFKMLDRPSAYSDCIGYEAIQTLSMDVKRVLFGKISSRNALVNKELKKLAKMVGIDKNVSFHIARHSFASKAKNQGIPSTKIKGLLAHSKIDTTERYMGEFDTDETDAALAEIFNDGSPKSRLMEIVSRMDDAEVENLIRYIENGKPSLL